MRFRSKHIADSVSERIAGIADSIQNDKPLPPPRGASMISLDRQDNGDLMVTKSFENGETELLTISNSETDQPPEGLVQIGGAPEQQLTASTDPAGIVENAASGGNALDAILRN